ncbi:MAG: creatininase family protein [Rhizobiales bacterium]|nr:creatininase family protein [Hyphomicrobiales bacterium]
MLTSKELGEIIAGGMDLVLFPVGATEQHGPHLATGTDTISPAEIAARVSERTGVVVAPAMPFGLSLGHTAQWPGTLSLHPQTMTQVMVEVGRWIVGSGFTKLIFLSGHGLNAPPLECARVQLRYEFPKCRFRVISLFDASARLAATYAMDAADFHANQGETSLLMHLRPEMVRADLLVDEPDVTPGLIFSYDMPATTRSGVVGHARRASPEDGKALAAMLVDDIAAIVGKALAEEWPEPPGST